MNLRYPSPGIPSKYSVAFYGAYFAILGVVVPYLGPYLQARGVAAVGIGLVTAAFSLAKLVYTPFLGAAVDRGFWFRGILTLHVGLSLACAVVLDLLKSDPRLLVGAFFLIGLGYGTVLPLVEATILEQLPRRRYGWLRLWGSVGFVVAATLAVPAVNRDIRTAFPVILAVTLALLWLGCLPFEVAAHPPRKVARVKLSPTVWGLLVILTLNQVVHGPYYAFFSIHLKDHGFSSLVVSVMWSLGVTAELCAFVAGPWLENRLGLRRMLGLALLLAPLRWLMLAAPLSMATLAIAQVGHAATYALAHLAGIQLVQANAPAGSVRYAQALYSGLCFGLGIVAGSALSGPIFGRYGGSGSFLIAAVIASIVFLAWTPMSRKLRE